MSTFKIEKLDQLLKGWEDINFAAEVVEAVVEANLKNGIVMSGSNLEGSQIGVGDRELYKHIPNYKLLRKGLESGKTDLDYNKFLPWVPKDYKAVFNNRRLLFTFCGVYCYAYFALPMFILKWFLSKRVCVISQDAKIESRDFKQDSWLSKLPYQEFILILPKPLRLEPMRSVMIDYSTIILCKEDGFLYFFAIPDNIDDSLLVAKNKEKATTFLKSTAREQAKMLRKSKWQKFFSEEIGLNRIYTLQGIFSEEGLLHAVNPNGGFVYRDLDGKVRDKNNSIIKTDPESDFISESVLKIMMHVNGFAYALANAIPGDLASIIDLHSIEPISEEKEEVSTSEKTASSDKLVSLAWNEVPDHNIQHLRVKKVGGKVQYFKSTGLEMPPHVRRAHKHHYRTKNGLIEKWLKPIIVRKDKLEKQSMQGGVLTVKE